MKIYVVFGKSGEYSDRTYWMVCAFTTEAEAQKRVAAASARAREIATARRWDQDKCKLEKENQFDPHMSLSDYDFDTSYYYDEVELIETSATSAQPQSPKTEDGSA